MKADSGSWLYILLSVVFLVLSALGNKGKKAQTTSTPPINDEDYEPSPKPHQWPKSLEDVLNEVLEVPKPREAEVKPMPWQRTEVLESTQNSYEKIEDEAQSLETIEQENFTYDAPTEILKAKTEKIEAPEPMVVAEAKEPVLQLNNLDLRQGIIYAEILNRKYF